MRPIVPTLVLPIPGQNVNVSRGIGDLENVQDSGARLQCNFELCMQNFQFLVIFFSYNTVGRSIVGFTLHTDYRIKK